MRKYVAYQGPVILGIVLVIVLLWSTGWAHAIDQDKPPPIHIKTRLNENSSRNILRKTHEMCLTGAEVGLPVDKSPVDWSKLFYTIEDEYFDGIKYAKYVDSANIDMEDNCHIKVIKTHTADIDDGVHQYSVDLISGDVDTRDSSLVGMKRAAQMQSKFTGMDPKALKQMADKLRLQETTDALATQKVGNDVVLGAKCDYIVTKFARHSKLCYWSESHDYPGPIPRPIVLKSSVKLGKYTNTGEAIIFDVAKPIDKDIFRPSGKH
jgi:hypothetical protein